MNKLLQKRPENRFASASEVATALREAGLPTNWGKDFLMNEAME